MNKKQEIQKNKIKKDILSFVKSDSKPYNKKAFLIAKLPDIIDLAISKTAKAIFEDLEKIPHQSESCYIIHWHDFEKLKKKWVKDEILEKTL